MFDDGLAELPPRFGISERFFIGGARDADGLRRDADAAAFEICEGDRKSFTAFAENPVFRNGAVAQCYRTRVGSADAELVLHAVDGEARRIGRYDERGQSLFSKIGIGHREY